MAYSALTQRLKPEPGELLTARLKPCPSRSRVPLQQLENWSVELYCVLELPRYLCWLTESTLPSGSLNQAILSPVGAVQIPSSLSWTKGYFSKATPRF